MSERYGKCPRCEGWGDLLVIPKSVTQPLDHTEIKKIECGDCGGTGFNGYLNRDYEMPLFNFAKRKN